ncbi:MAG: NADH-quinone oxidoreductase subunit A [Candidatus Sericytochromatia bacterium]
MESFGRIGFMIAFAFIVPTIALVLSRFLQPRLTTASKVQTYECGIKPYGSAWVQFNIRYYIYALIFVIFDIETVFLYPWAVAFNKLGLFAVVEMFIFLAILIVGFAYAWKKGALDWH